METKFEEGRHENRVSKIKRKNFDKLEKEKLESNLSKDLLNYFENNKIGEYDIKEFRLQEKVYGNGYWIVTINPFVLRKELMGNRWVSFLKDLELKT